MIILDHCRPGDVRPGEEQCGIRLWFGVFWILDLMDRNYLPNFVPCWWVLYVRNAITAQLSFADSHWSSCIISGWNKTYTHTNYTIRQLAWQIPFVMAMGHPSQEQPLSQATAGCLPFLRRHWNVSLLYIAPHRSAWWVGRKSCSCPTKRFAESWPLTVDLAIDTDLTLIRLGVGLHNRAHTSAPISGSLAPLIQTPPSPFCLKTRSDDRANDDASSLPKGL